MTGAPSSLASEKVFLLRLTSTMSTPSQGRCADELEIKIAKRFLPLLNPISTSPFSSTLSTLAVIVV